jgi:5-methylcytosine-specific restriction endonuclease McrA
MVKKRSQTLRNRTFERDNFTCRKCGLVDKEKRKLEAHHVIPLYSGGKDELENLITLCLNCHHFAPDKKEDFENYLKEESTGTGTVLFKILEKVRQEHPEFFEDLGKK